MTDQEIKEHLTSMAKFQEEGIDTLAAAVQDLYKVIDHLSQTLRTADITIAALRHCLVSTNVVEDEKIDAMITRISETFNKKMQNFVPDEKVPVAQNMQSELEIIHASAKEAAKTPYDSDAFIFGG